MEKTNNSWNLLLTILFIVIIYHVVVKGIPSQIVIGTLCMWFVVLWISWDNLGAWDASMIDKTVSVFSTKPKSPKRREIEKRIKEGSGEAGVGHADEDESSETDVDEDALIPFAERPMPLEYSENNYKENLFPELGSSADNGLAGLQKFRGNLNRVAMDNQARVDKYTNIGYFAEELDEHANSIWWDDDVALEPKF